MITWHCVATSYQDSSEKLWFKFIQIKTKTKPTVLIKPNLTSGPAVDKPQNGFTELLLTLRLFF